MIIILTLILFSIGLSFAAAVNDFMRLKIPNYLPLLIFVSFLIAASGDIFFKTGMFENLTTHFIVGACVFMVMLICFFTGLFGGGDAKMISALSFWMGVQGLSHFLMVMAIAGGILALISVGLRRTDQGKKLLDKLAGHPKLHSEWISSMADDKTIVPYGIAIAFGSLAGFYGAFILP